MSALSKLVYGVEQEGGRKPWPHFTEKFPVKTLIIENEELCKDLENDIREAGDYLQKRTSAKCLMTKWNMHEDYESFAKVGDYAIKLAQSCPVAKRTTPDGKIDVVPLHVNETWGLIYTKGDTTKVHNHWPSLWSYTYCVKADECCSPLIFPTATPMELEIVPKTGQLILFPAWLMHEVYKQTCDHERIMISGNLEVNWNLSTNTKKVTSWPSHEAMQISSVTFSKETSETTEEQVVTETKAPPTLKYESEFKSDSPLAGLWRTEPNQTVNSHGEPEIPQGGVLSGATGDHRGFHVAERGVLQSPTNWGETGPSVGEDHVVNSLFPSPVYCAIRDSNLDLTEELALVPRFITADENKDIRDIIAEGVQSNSLHGDNSNFSSKNTSIFDTRLPNIKNFCEHHIKKYVEKIINPKEELDFYITQSWLNVNKPGQEHHAHWHQNSIISGVFYIETGGTEDSITFYDPNLNLKDIIKFETLENNFWNSRNWSINITNNALILFPSWLQHSVPANKTTNTDRISISFNTFAKGIFGKKEALTELIL